MKALSKYPPGFTLQKANRQYMVGRDVSQYGVVAVLFHCQDDEKSQDWETLKYCSKLFSKEKHRYSAT